MTAAVATQSEAFAHELRSLLKDLDPARRRDELEVQLRVKLDEIRQTLERLLDNVQPDGTFGSLRGSLASVHSLLANAVPSPTLPMAEARTRWEAFRKQLLSAYEALCKELTAWDVHVPSLRPTNYTRNIFHAAHAMAAVGVLKAFGASQGMMLLLLSPFVIFAVTAEWSRRRWPAINDRMMKVFGPVAHPHEAYRINSATWFAFALLFLVLLNVPVASAVALAALGFGDPAAAIIGRRFGRTRLMNGRTLEGCLAFAGVGAVASIAVLGVVEPQLTLGQTVLVSVLGASAGSLAELVSLRIDDNLTIPVAAGTTVAIVVSILGIA